MSDAQAQTLILLDVASLCLLEHTHPRALARRGDKEGATNEGSLAGAAGKAEHMQS